MILVKNFSPPENQGEFHLVSTSEELFGMFDLKIEIMVGNLRPHLDFLYMSHMPVLTCHFGAFCDLIAILAIIHDTAYRRLGVRRDLDKVLARFIRLPLRFLYRDDPDLVPLLIDQADGRNPDVAIYSYILVSDR